MEALQKSAEKIHLRSCDQPAAACSARLAHGNLITAVDFIMGKWNYIYDNLNRLAGAAALVSQPTGMNAYYAGVQTGWSYDPFGNGTAETHGAIAGATPRAYMPASSTAQFAASNQISNTSLASGLTYDAAGDITYVGINHYSSTPKARQRHLSCAVQD